MSVIIPVYNREFLLEDAVKSVYHQNYRPIECILVDDGSTDQSVAVIEKLAKQLSEEDFLIKLYKQSNAGAPAARNTGIQNALGEFIQFLDSDDLLYPEKIEAQVKFLERNLDCDGVYGDWNHGTKENYKLIKGEKWDDLISQFYCGRVIHTLSFLFRRPIIKKIGFWDEKLRRNQEIDYFLRGLLAGGQFEYLPVLTGLWREHSGERIVSSNGALSALEFHDKWILEFQRLEIFTLERKKTAAQFLFWHAMELGSGHKTTAIKYLQKAFGVFKELPEFNTYKMKLIRSFLGAEKSIRIWYERAKSK